MTTLWFFSILPQFLYLCCYHYFVSMKKLTMYVCKVLPEAARVTEKNIPRGSIQSQCPSGNWSQVPMVTGAQRMLTCPC